jgi:hypothetical protein
MPLADCLSILLENSAMETDVVPSGYSCSMSPIDCLIFRRRNHVACCGSFIDATKASD